MLPKIEKKVPRVERTKKTNENQSTLLNDIIRCKRLRVNDTSSTLSE